jgi:hypothetical protein
MFLSCLRIVLTAVGSHCNSCLLVRSFKENLHDAIIPDHDSVRASGRVAVHDRNLPRFFLSLTPFECIRGHLHFLMVNPSL